MESSTLRFEACRRKFAEKPIVRFGGLWNSGLLLVPRTFNGFKVLGRRRSTPFVRLVAHGAPLVAVRSGLRKM
jgi:hypothetical protein